MPDNNKGIEISLDATLVVILGVLLIATLIPFYGWLLRRKDFRNQLLSHIRRWAPIYMVLGPPATFYFLICGLISATYALFLDPWQFEGMSREAATSTVAFQGFYYIEWICSLTGTVASLYLIRWIRLPFFWHGIVTTSMGFTAVYRTAAYRTMETGFGSGPAVLGHPALADALPVILGALIFWALNRFPMNLGKHRKASA